MSTEAVTEKEIPASVVELCNARTRFHLMQNYLLSRNKQRRNWWYLAIYGVIYCLVWCIKLVKAKTNAASNAGIYLAKVVILVFEVGFYKL